MWLWPIPPWWTKYFLHGSMVLKGFGVPVPVSCPWSFCWNEGQGQKQRKSAREPRVIYPYESMNAYGSIMVLVSISGAAMRKMNVWAKRPCGLAQLFVENVLEVHDVSTACIIDVYFYLYIYFYIYIHRNIYIYFYIYLYTMWEKQIGSMKRRAQVSNKYSKLPPYKMPGQKDLCFL